MLPERFVREFFGRPAIEAPESDYVAFWMHFTGQRLNTKPHTLAGDAWRTAWAEAHDKQTDVALDAVY